MHHMTDNHYKFWKCKLIIAIFKVIDIKMSSVYDIKKRLKNEDQFEWLAKAEIVSIYFEYDLWNSHRN